MTSDGRSAVEIVVTAASVKLLAVLGLVSSRLIQSRPVVLIWIHSFE